MSPFFSVIIPFYKRDNLLLEALESVCNQSYREYEIILINDGSPSISNKLQKFLKAHAEIRYMEQPHSGFPGQVRNRAALQARGEWLAFLDSDDLWAEQTLERCKELIDSGAFPLIHSREQWLRDNRTISQRKQRHKREGDIFQDALKKCIIGPSTTVMRRDLYTELSGFREDLEIAEDYEFWLRYCARYRVSYIEEPLVIKRMGPWEQLSTKYEEIEIFRIEGLQTLVDENYFSPEKQALATAELARKCQIYGLGAEKRGHLEQAATYFSLAKTYGYVTF